MDTTQDEILSASWTGSAVKPHFYRLLSQSICGASCANLSSSGSRCQDRVKNTRGVWGRGKTPMKGNVAGNRLVRESLRV